MLLVFHPHYSHTIFKMTSKKEQDERLQPLPLERVICSASANGASVNVPQADTVMSCQADLPPGSCFHKKKNGVHLGYHACLRKMRNSQSGSEQIWDLDPETADPSRAPPRDLESTTLLVLFGF